MRRMAAHLQRDVGTGLAIVGEAGVGKTRLAEELIRSVAERGRAVERIVGSPAGASIPFAALAHRIAVPTGSSEPGQLMARLLGWFAEHATPSGPLVLVVDDAHHLDEHTASLVQQALAHDLASVVLTKRPGEPRPWHVEQLMNDERVERVELGPLSEQETRELAAMFLDGPVHPLTASELWRQSRGNPLVVRELLLAGQEAETLVRTDGLWRSIGPLAPSGRLVDLVEARLGRLGDGQRAVLEALAVASSLELSFVQGLAPAAAIEDLEERRVVEVERAGNRHLVRLAHPIYGEVVGARLPRTRARRIMLDLADRLAAAGTRRAEDMVRLALWQLEGGATPDAPLLLAAANEALGVFDQPLAERFARAAARDGQAGVTALVLLGRALAGQQRVDEADDAFRQAANRATGDEAVARVALARSNLLYFRAGRIVEAAEILTEALGRVDDRDWRDEINALLTLFQAAAGELRAVAAAGRAMAERHDARPRAVVHTLLFSSVANVMLGRLAEAQEQVRLGLRLAPEVRDDLPLSGEMLQINGVMAAAYGGRLAEAVERGNAGHRAAVETGASEVAAMWAMNLAECQVLTGDIAGALDMMLASLTLLRERDPFSVHGIAASIASMCATWLGRLDLAVALHGEVVDQGLARDVRSRIQHERATAWVTWLREGPSSAAELAIDAGRRALTDTHVVWAAWLFHDAVRLGVADQPADRLGLLAQRIEGDLVPTMALHARALASNDGVALERAASAFERLGSPLFAAEAAAHARQAYLRQGRERLASVAGARASLLAAQSPGVRTPPLSDATPVALTPRELEIARIAAEGRSSREVAARLGISVRTVDNHLGAIYDKLGVTGRAELPRVLGISSLTTVADAAG
jgi:DNA-binding CsgD family transcriptional regulator/tetratricopeptide (TPR) repeat protein